MVLSQPVRSTIRDLTQNAKVEIAGQRIEVEHLASEMTPDGLWRLTHVTINGASRGKKIELIKIDSQTGDIRKRQTELDLPPAFTCPTWYFDEAAPLSKKVEAWRATVISRQQELAVTNQRERARGLIAMTV